MSNEKRLIDANAVKRAIEEVMAENSSEELFIVVAKHICNMLDYAPTVDAVEVVRCKDCKFALGHPYNAEKLVCSKGINWRGVEPNHFCSYGERRE